MFQAELDKANEKLKAGNVKVTINQAGSKLILRTTLPPKPESPKTSPFQQEIYLGYSATPAGLQQAVSKAHLLRAQLDLGKFDWEDWRQRTPGSSLLTVANWISKFEEDHWAKNKRTPEAVETWARNYMKAFKKLDFSSELSLDLLLETVRKTEPDSAIRKSTAMYLAKLARFVGLNDSGIKDLSGSYSPSEVNPRNLPSDQLICEWRSSIKNPRWRWVFGMMACYGLRNHECFRLDLSEFPVVWVLRGKTGQRFVYPLFPEWATEWQLDSMTLPTVRRDYSNAELGTKVCIWFSNNRKLFRPGFKAYDLRHCYARRTFEFGLAPDWSAGLMGHSTQVHEKTYRAWIDKETYRKAYNAVVFREGRPLPPIV